MLYMNPILAYEVLKDFSMANKDLLGQFEIDLNLYGKFDFSGVHDNEPAPVYDFYIKEW